MSRVYLGLGSNLGDREGNLREALRLLEPEVRVRAVSAVYETRPVGYAQQGWFLNAVAEAETALEPEVLLRLMRAVEQALGRERVIVNGPRTVDLDLLLYSNDVIETGELTLPHPRMQERRFVLAPLADLAPDLRHPVLKRTVREMLEDVAGQEIRRTEIRLDAMRPGDPSSR